MDSTCSYDVRHSYTTALIFDTCERSSAPKFDSQLCDRLLSACGADAAAGLASTSGVIGSALPLLLATQQPN